MKTRLHLVNLIQILDQQNLSILILQDQRNFWRSEETTAEKWSSFPVRRGYRDQDHFTTAGHNWWTPRDTQMVKRWLRNISSLLFITWIPQHSLDLLGNSRQKKKEKHFHKTHFCSGELIATGGCGGQKIKGSGKIHGEQVSSRANKPSDLDTTPSLGSPGITAGNMENIPAEGFFTAFLREFPVFPLSNTG